MPIHKRKSVAQLRVEAIDSIYKYNQYQKRVVSDRAKKQNASSVSDWVREWENAKRIQEERSRTQTTEVH